MPALPALPPLPPLTPALEGSAAGPPVAVGPPGARFSGMAPFSGTAAVSGMAPFSAVGSLLAASVGPSPLVIASLERTLPAHPGESPSPPVDGEPPQPARTTAAAQQARGVLTV